MFKAAWCYVKLVWRRYKASMRLDLDLVCELSKGRGPHDDYHDYPDDLEFPHPCHFVAYTCHRCGKEFFI
jgi:hypothetical protein